MDDQRFMRAALREAERGILRTSPNPAVGAVIVRGGRIVARGFHRRAGLPHAEVEALRAVPDARRAAGATLYVTLEPCSTHGRTPPCVSAIIAAGIQRVVIGTIDPNPLHAGRALEFLRKAGIEATSGVLEEECRQLNRSYNKWIVSGLPFVVAKAAVSLDGRLSRPPGEPRWLTSAASRADAHLLRARADAILIGANTLRIDNPRLTVRGVRGARQPWRVVLAGRRAVPRDLHLFTDRHKDRTVVYTRKSLRSVLRDLGGRSVTSVLIEGGMRVLGEAFDEQLVDEVHFYLAPRICGGPISAVGGKGVASSKAAPIIRNVHFQRINGDLRITGVPNYAQEL